MVKVQEYINKNYKNKAIKELYISKKNLEGSLDLSNFINLEKLNCSHNSITNLDLTNCPIVEIDCSDNSLASLDFLSVLDNKKLEALSFHSNKLTSQDLSIFSEFTNLKTLLVGNREKGKMDKLFYNDFHGSLMYLKDLEKLEELDISNTEIDSGLEYLPSSIKSFYVYTERDSVFRTRIIVNELTKFGEPEKGIFSLPDFANLLAIWKSYKTSSLIRLVSQLEEKLKEKNNEFVQQQKSQEKLKNDLIIIEETLDGVRNSSEELDIETLNNYKNASRKLTELSYKLAQAETELNKANQVIKKTVKEKQEIEERNTENNKLQSQLQVKSDKLERALREIGNLKSQLGISEIKKDDLQFNIERKEAEIISKDTIITKLKQRKQELKEEIRKLDDEIRKLSESVDENKYKIKRLERDKSGLENDLEEIENTLKVVEREKQELESEIEKAHLDPDVVDKCALSYKKKMVDWLRDDLEGAKDKITDLSTFHLNNFQIRFERLERLVEQNKKTKAGDQEWQDLFSSLETCQQVLKKIFSSRLEVEKNNNQQNKELEEKLRTLELERENSKLKSETQQYIKRLDYLQEKLEEEFQDHSKLFNTYISDKKKQFTSLAKEIEDKLDEEGKKIFRTWREDPTAKDNLVEILKGRGVNDEKRQQLQDIRNELRKLEIKWKDLEKKENDPVNEEKKIGQYYRQSLSEQLEEKKQEIEESLAEMKNKLKNELGEELEFLLEMLLKTQVDVIKLESDSIVQKSLDDLKTSLSKKIGEKEIETICQKQRITVELEEVIQFLEASQNLEQQTQAKIIQAEPLASYKGGNK